MLACICLLELIINQRRRAPATPSTPTLPQMDWLRWQTASRPSTSATTLGAPSLPTCRPLPPTVSPHPPGHCGVHPPPQLRLLQPPRSNRAAAVKGSRWLVQVVRLQACCVPLGAPCPLGQWRGGGLVQQQPLQLALLLLAVPRLTLWGQQQQQQQLRLLLAPDLQGSARDQHLLR